MRTQDPLFKTPERIDENREWQIAQDIQKVGYEWFLLLSMMILVLWTFVYGFLCEYLFSVELLDHVVIL